MADAKSQYDSDWANACQSVAEINAESLKDCLHDPSVMSNQYMGAAYCKRTYGNSDPSPECTLPRKRSETVNEYHKQAQARCAAEARLGVEQ